MMRMKTAKVLARMLRHPKNQLSTMLIKLVCLKLYTSLVLLMMLFKTSPECTLFVGNLSFDCGEESLSEFFTEGGCPPESVRILTSDGRSKGYLYLHFPFLFLIHLSLL